MSSRTFIYIYIYIYTAAGMRMVLMKSSNLHIRFEFYLQSLLAIFLSEVIACNSTFTKNVLKVYNTFVVTSCLYKVQNID